MLLTEEDLELKIITIIWIWQIYIDKITFIIWLIRSRETGCDEEEKKPCQIYMKIYIKQSFLSILIHYFNTHM